MRYPSKGTDVAASERSRKWLFAFQCRLLMTKQCTLSWWLSRKAMRLLTSQRVNLLGVSQEQSKRGDVTASPTI